MSGGFAVIPIAWMDDDRLTRTDLSVLIALSTWTGGEIRPSHAAIAKRARVSEQAVGLALDHLQELGLVGPDLDLQWQDAT